MKKPNIVYILADDLGYGDLQCYGESAIPTPHIDELAKEGVRFSDAHSPSAVCTPTRYSVLTGRYSWRSRLKESVLGGHSEPLIEPERLTVPSFLKENGYETACIGKWHLGLGWGKDGEEFDYQQPITGGPTELGFDYFYGIPASLDMPPYCFIENDRTVGIPSVEKEPKDFSQAGRTGLMTPGWKDEEVNETLTQKAESYISDHVKSKQNLPFFMYFPVTGPHTPWLATEQFRGKSGVGPRGDMIMELDATVGRIIKTLKDLNEWDNTLLIFTSDNGPHPATEEITIHGHKPAGDLRGQKADIWEGGHRVPFIASWPGTIREGTVSDQMVCLVDLLATCADMINEPLPSEAGEDTLSMIPAFTENKSIRESVIHHSITGMFSIRRRDWKLIQGKGSGGFGVQSKKDQLIGLPTQGRSVADHSPGQLYNINVDEAEQNNLYLQEPEIVEELTNELISIINAGENVKL